MTDLRAAAERIRDDHRAGYEPSIGALGALFRALDAPTPEPSAEAPQYTEGYVDGIRAALAEPSAEARLIAACPDCGDEFDVTDEAGRLRTEAHARRHHPEPSAEADTPARGRIRDILYETRRLDGPTIWRLAEDIEAAARAAAPHAEVDAAAWHAAVCESPTGRAAAPSDGLHPDWRDATPEQWDTARDTLNDAAHFDAMLIERYPNQRDNYVAYIVAKAASEPSAEADAALRQAEIAFTEVANSPSAVHGVLAVPYYRDVERIWAAILPFLSRPTTPPLDVAARIYRDKHQPDCRCEGCRAFDDPEFAREYAALAIPTPDKEVSS